MLGFYPKVLKIVTGERCMGTTHTIGNQEADQGNY